MHCYTTLQETEPLPDLFTPCRLRGGSSKEQSCSEALFGARNVTLSPCMLCMPPLMSRIRELTGLGGGFFLGFMAWSWLGVPTSPDITPGDHRSFHVQCCDFKFKSMEAQVPSFLLFSTTSATALQRRVG